MGPLRIWKEQLDENTDVVIECEGVVMQLSGSLATRVEQVLRAEHGLALSNVGLSLDNAPARRSLAEEVARALGGD